MIDGLKLSIYFGERDEVDSGFLADRLLDIFEASGIRTGILIRAVEGFGIKHQRRTDRLLSLSEDLPLVAVGVDCSERVERAAAEIEALRFDGLITLERVRLTGEARERSSPPAEADDTTKLTLYLGRGRRIDGRPVYEVAVDQLRRSGVEGASVLLGVDGIRDGTRSRARFFSRNVEVPAMVVSVGSSKAVASAIPGLEALPGNPTVTVERARVCKRDGVGLAVPGDVPDADADGMNLWQKLMLYSSEQAHFNGSPVHIEAIRRLRGAGASGATALRGIWGYDGRHEPHGDSLRSLRRQVPTLTVVVDTPANTRRWFALLDEITPERGLITSEIVPALRARGPAIAQGGLRLARRRPLS